MFESQNVVAKIYLKDKFYIRKMRESYNVTKHIHLFQTNLHQLTKTSVVVLNDKTIICFMRSMLPSYKIFKKLHKNWLKQYKAYN